MHSRLNEVNIAGMWPYVIAEPTPQKQKGACSSGEPQRTTEAFQCIGAKKKNRNKRGKKCCRSAKVDHTIKSLSLGGQSKVFFVPVSFGINP